MNHATTTHPTSPTCFCRRLENDVTVPLVAAFPPPSVARVVGVCQAPSTTLVSAQMLSGATHPHWAIVEVIKLVLSPSLPVGVFSPGPNAKLVSSPSLHRLRGTHASDVDSYCASFCAQLRPEDTSDTSSATVWRGLFGLLRRSPLPLPHDTSSATVWRGLFGLLRRSPLPRRDPGLITQGQKHLHSGSRLRLVNLQHAQGSQQGHA